MSDISKFCEHCGRYEVKWLATMLSGQQLCLCENCYQVAKMRGTVKKSSMIYL